ncbi:MAG: hypothetical protein WC373_17505 [Smithella sp.]|jgi:hypothetical protein
MKDIVTITCYKQTEKMERKAAIEKFLDGMANSEGSEQSRYVKIYLGLISGLSAVSD